MGNGTLAILEYKNALDNYCQCKTINLLTNEQKLLSEDADMMSGSDNNDKLVISYTTFPPQNNGYLYRCMEVYGVDGMKYTISGFIACAQFSNNVFGSLSDTLLFNTITTEGHSLIKHINYKNNKIEKEDDIGCVCKSNNGWMPIGYVSDNELFGVFQQTHTGAIYDTNTRDYSYTIPLLGADFILEHSTDNAFIAINYHEDIYGRCDKIADSQRCLCNAIDIFFKNKKTVKIRDEYSNEENHTGIKGFAIHPNNRVIARLSQGKIDFWHAYTGKQFKFQDKWPSYVNNNVASSRLYRRCLSFSPDGTCVAGVFDKACIVFRLPFEIIHGIHIKKEQLIWLCCVLKKCPYSKANNDIQSLLMNKIWDISKWIK